jgi:cardiolipin synthase A/B
VSPFGWFEALLALYIAWVIGACATLLMNRRSPTATLAWMFAFIALPFVSGIYYLVFGPRRLHRRRLRYHTSRGLLANHVSEYLRSSCCTVQPKLSRDAAALAAVGERLGQGLPTFARGIQLLDEGDEYLAALETAIATARHHVHLEYYIWDPDEVGTHFRGLLVEARERGVTVRVLFDAVGSPGARDAFWKPLRDAGGHVLVFNPMRFSPASLNFANFRTHRKIAVCDGIVGLLGGMNVHLPASSSRSGAAAWRDAHVLIEGEPVRRLQRLFLENWMYAGGAFTLTPENLPKYFPSALVDPAHEIALPVQVLASGPDDERAPIHAFFLAAISTARSRIWIETPYLIPDEPLEAALRIAVLRGVSVQVIVPKEGDSRLVTAASHTYCESLSKAGVQVYEYGPPMLHSKTMLIDETVGVVGTANMDNRSFRLNFEVAAVFYDAKTIARMARRFLEDRAYSHPFPSRRRGPRITTVLESLARLTSPVL